MKIIECEHNQMGLQIWAQRGMKQLASRYKIRRGEMRKGYCYLDIQREHRARGEPNLTKDRAK